MENQQTNDATLTIINGGVEIEVQHLDGSKETIKVRRLPLRLLPAFGAAQGDEYKLLELFTLKDEAWLDSVVPDDQVKMVELGDELNSSFFAQWAERRLAANEKLKASIPSLAS